MKDFSALSPDASSLLTYWTVAMLIEKLSGWLTPLEALMFTA